MTIDNLALILCLATDTDQVSELIESELGHSDDALDNSTSLETSKGGSTTFVSILTRIEKHKVPFVNDLDRIEFCSWRESQPQAASSEAKEF